MFDCEGWEIEVVKGQEGARPQAELSLGVIVAGGEAKG